MLKCIGWGRRGACRGQVQECWIGERAAEKWVRGAPDGIWCLEEGVGGWTPAFKKSAESSTTRPSRFRLEADRDKSDTRYLDSAWIGWTWMSWAIFRVNSVNSGKKIQQILCKKPHNKSWFFREIRDSSAKENLWNLWKFKKNPWRFETNLWVRDPFKSL